MTVPPTDYATAATLVEAIAAGRLSAVEVTERAIERVARLNPGLNAFMGLNPRALDEARAADRKVSRGNRGPLLGVPVAIKDLILGRDAPTTAGSRIFGNGLVSDHDAPVIQRLRRAGAVILGRTGLHELALGVTNENEHFGVVRNPWDPTRVPGGSSGGSAAAVAAGLCPLAVGSDTRGSIRIPAACCGVTGLKATYGSVPTRDVIPLSWSLDHVGPIARTAEDAAVMLGVMIGGRAGEHYARALGRGVSDLRFGIGEYFVRDLDPEIAGAVFNAMAVFRDAGATVQKIDIPGIDDAHGISATITLAEAVTYHHQALKERPEGFGPKVRERLEGGLRLTAVDLVRAERRKLEIVAAIRGAFREVDCIVGATLPLFPGLIGQGAARLNGRDTTLLAEFPRLTSPANLAGSPAITVPCGLNAGGLPVGLQLMAAPGREDIILAAAAFYQRQTDFHLLTPDESRGFTPS